MSVVLNATSALLSVTSFTFYFIGVIGYSIRKETVKNVNWFHNFQRNKFRIDAGLRAVYSDSNGVETQFLYANCTDDFCDRCDKYGHSTFALLVVALILSFIVTLLSASGAFAPSSALSGANIALSITSVLFGAVGFGLFTHICFPKLENEVNSDWDYGPGAIFTLIAFLLMFIVTVLQVVAAALTPKTETTTAAPVKSEAVSTNEL